MHLSQDVADSRSCWCGASSWTLRFRTSRFGLIQCLRCGCYRIDPPPVKTSEQAESFYTQYYLGAARDTTRGTTKSSRFWRVAERVPPLQVPGQAALDFGCGEGILCAELKASGWKSVVGFDVSQSRIARARQSHPEIDFIEQGQGQSGLRCCSFDLVVMDNVVEHLLLPLETLAELKGCIRPGGRIVVITPNMESGCFRLLGRRWTPELAPHAHVFLFTPRALRSLAQRAGFVVDQVGHFHTGWLDLRDWIERLRSGVKRTSWCALQEAGKAYSWLVDAGPMLYAVCRHGSA